MRRSWLYWGLPLLLAASVLAGMAIERPVDPSSDPAATESSEKTELPRFDCEDRTVGPYQPDLETRQRQLDWLTDNLELSENQVDEVLDVFVEMSREADVFWREARDEYCELRDRMRAQIRDELSAEQNRTLDRLLEEHRAKKSEARPSSESTADREKSP